MYLLGMGIHSGQHYGCAAQQEYRNLRLEGNVVRGGAARGKYRTAETSSSRRALCFRLIAIVTFMQMQRSSEM